MSALAWNSSALLQFPDDSDNGADRLRMIRVRDSFGSETAPRAQTITARTGPDIKFLRGGSFWARKPPTGAYHYREPDFTAAIWAELKLLDAFGPSFW